MKRIAGILLALLLLALFGCAAPEQPVEEPTALVTPQTRDVKLTLPLKTQREASAVLQAYTAGFSDPKGMPLTFRCESADPSVAICALSEDGTLFISAAGVGETELTVTAIAADGRAADAVIGVKVTDARRIAALIVLGVLVVALLILFGKPVKAEPEPAETPEPEEPETQSERSLP